MPDKYLKISQQHVNCRSYFWHHIWAERQAFSWITLLICIPLFEQDYKIPNFYWQQTRFLTIIIPLYSSISYLDFGNQFHERPAVIMSYQFHYELFESWEFMDSPLTSWTSSVQWGLRRWFWKKNQNQNPQKSPQQIKIKTWQEKSFKK